MEKIAGLLMIVMLLSACMPSVYHTIDPVKVDKWDSGKSIIIQESESFKGSVSFKNYYDGKIFFEIEIENKGFEPVLISPENFYYAVFTDTTYTNENTLKRINAVDAEKEILDLERQMSQEARQHCLLSGCNLLFSLASLTESHKNETVEQREKREQEERENEIIDQQNEESYKRRMKEYDDEKKMWEGTFRKTTLEQNQVLKKEISFKNNFENNPNICVVFKSGDEMLFFRFKTVKKNF